MSDSLLPYDSDDRVRMFDEFASGSVGTGAAATMPPKAPRREARTVIALLAIAILAELVWATHSWIVLHYVSRIHDGDRTLRPTVDDWHAIGTTIHMVTWGLRAAVGVFVIDWMLCVRTNAEAYHPGAFRRSRGWIIWGWICPGLNLWYPYECMADTWASSDPKRNERLPVKATPPAPLVFLWWTSLLSGISVYLVASIVGRTASDYALRKVGVEMETLSHLLLVVAAGLLIAIVSKVTMFGRLHRRIYRAQVARA